MSSLELMTTIVVTSGFWLIAVAFHFVRSTKSNSAQQEDTSEPIKGEVDNQFATLARKIRFVNDQDENFLIQCGQYKNAERIFIFGGGYGYLSKGDESLVNLLIQSAKSKEVWLFSNRKLDYFLSDPHSTKVRRLFKLVNDSGRFIYKQNMQTFASLVQYMDKQTTLYEFSPIRSEENYPAYILHISSRDKAIIDGHEISCRNNLDLLISLIERVTHENANNGQVGHTQIIQPIIMPPLSSDLNVMVSYNREDHPQVQAIVSYLKERGVKIWMDVDSINAGDDFMLKITQAIEIADVFVLMLGRTGLGKWQTIETKCAVKKYVEKELGFIIVPVLLGGCEGVPKDLELLGTINTVSISDINSSNDLDRLYRSVIGQRNV